MLVIINSSVKQSETIQFCTRQRCYIVLFISKKQAIYCMTL